MEKANPERDSLSVLMQKPSKRSLLHSKEMSVFYLLRSKYYQSLTFIDVKCPNETEYDFAIKYQEQLPIDLGCQQ